jgi:hypothetical protein
MDPYEWDVQLGQSAVKMQGGNLRVRRFWKNLPHYFEFVFRLTTDQMTQLVAFVDVTGSAWFEMPGISMYSGAVPVSVVKPMAVRFIGDMSIGATGYDWWTVTVPGEISPSMLEALQPQPTAGWIIGRTPQDPSPDWVIAGTPGSPSPDWVLAGTPSNPSIIYP